MKTLQEQLIEKGLSKSIEISISKPKLSKEKLSKQELEELMGCNRPTYRRVGGAIKRKR